MLFDKIASVYFIRKIYLYFSIGQETSTVPIVSAHVRFLYIEHIITSSSVTADGPRDALSQSKSCQLLQNYRAGLGLWQLARMRNLVGIHIIRWRLIKSSWTVTDAFNAFLIVHSKLSKTCCMSSQHSQSGSGPCGINHPSPSPGQTDRQTEKHMTTANTALAQRRAVKSLLKKIITFKCVRKVYRVWMTAA